MDGQFCAGRLQSLCENLVLVCVAPAFRWAGACIYSVGLKADATKEACDCHVAISPASHTSFPCGPNPRHFPGELPQRFLHLRQALEGRHGLQPELVFHGRISGMDCPSWDIKVRPAL